MREVGNIRQFDNGSYQLVEDNIIPEKDKQKFIVKLNIYALGFSILSVILIMVIMGSGSIDLIEFGVLLMGFVLFIVVHELLHGMSFVLDNDVTWKNIKFGVVLKSGMAYCISKVPVKVTISRISLMMPVYVVCAPMIIVGVILSNAALAIAGVLYLSGSVGDFYYMWKLRKTKGDFYMFEEMPSKSGYEVGYLLYKKVN